jgi:hypothetical protein
VYFWIEEFELGEKILSIGHDQDDRRWAIWALISDVHWGTVHSRPFVQLLKKWAPQMRRTPTMNKVFETLATFLEMSTTLPGM